MTQKLSPRIANLRQNLVRKGFEDRSPEWFRKSTRQDDSTQKGELPDVARKFPNAHVMVRRARAIDEMLKAMCNPTEFGYTHCFEIEDGDLLAGVIPMGSNGLGKVFPNYLTEEELRVGSVTNKTAMALLGHNTINYERVVNSGLQSKIDYAKAQLATEELSSARAIYDRLLMSDRDDIAQSLEAAQRLKKGLNSPYSKIAFYESVIISCEAVIAYAKRFSTLAHQQAERTKDGKRKAELERMALVLEKVPARPASNFYEALHGIWIVHCCLHASMDFMSLGRLDQVLNPFLEKESDREFALELFENFVIKAAGRLNFTTQYLVQQDHMDYNAALGIHSYYLDQRAGLNNFLQNIIIGGKTSDGSDATNDCTYLILEAFKKVNLSTPGIYVRLHQHSPDKLYRAVAEAIQVTGNLPYILNDEVMIPAMFDSLSAGEAPERYDEYQRLANDYCVDGCWEPILNGESEWTFGMINGMSILECSLNRGALLSSSPELLRGQKLSLDTGSINTFDELKTAVSRQIQFFVDQSALAMCLYYLTSEFVVPSPLVSALFGDCLKNGRDKSWGGAKYNLGGTVLGGVPDMVNTLSAIKAWVFDKKKYKFSEVVCALQNNYVAGDTGEFKNQRTLDAIKVDFFTNSPQFGNGPETNELTQFILDEFHRAVRKSAQLASKVFIEPIGDQDNQVLALRTIAGYYGNKALRTILPNFDLKFTVGLGTFEQYNWQGAGNAASAARTAGAPLSPNFTPASGTWHAPPSRLFETISTLEMNRFGAGVITDVCLENAQQLPELVRQFIVKRGGMLSVTIASSKYQEIYEVAKMSNFIENRKAATEQLMAYSDIMVRVGGWNAPFITLPLSHMENYINRPVSTV